MIKWASKYFGSVPAAFIDGVLYVLIAAFGALSAGFSTDEAAKYVSPETLFWVRTFCNVNTAWLLALKMFRSTAFAEHQQKKVEETQLIRRINEPGPTP